MRLGPRTLMPRLAMTLLVPIMLTFPWDSERAALLMPRRWTVTLPRPSRMLTMLLRTFLRAAHLRSMLLTLILATVVLGTDDSSMWCSVPLSARLKLCLSGLRMIPEWPRSIPLDVRLCGPRTRAVDIVTDGGASAILSII